MQSVCRSSVWIFTILIVLISCNKEEDSPTNEVNLWDCHHENSWNSSKTSNRLVGEWEWKSIVCYGYEGEINTEVHEGLTIEFKSDHTLAVKDNGQITQSSDWEVVDGDADLFAIKVTPSVAQLYGRILFCEEMVVFNDSYLDGCDNAFEKVQ